MTVYSSFALSGEGMPKRLLIKPKFAFFVDKVKERAGVVGSMTSLNRITQALETMCSEGNQITVISVNSENCGS